MAKRRRLNPKAVHILTWSIAMQERCLICIGKWAKHESQYGPINRWQRYVQLNFRPDGELEFDLNSRWFRFKNTVWHLEKARKHGIVFHYLGPNGTYVPYLFWAPWHERVRWRRRQQALKQEKRRYTRPPYISKFRRR